jgi:DNA processing protein
LLAWLAEQPSPLEVLATKAHPPDSWRRKTPNQRFVVNQRLPNALDKFSHVAVGIFDEEFPAALKHIPDPPLVLFCLGNLGMTRLRGVSVVGARRCTTLGKAIAYTLAAELAEFGFCVVSGLALGVDAAAHRGALSVAGYEPPQGVKEQGLGIKAELVEKPTLGARTTAVLGSGFGSLYPKQHSGLAKTILAADGLIVSEYPADTQPRPFQFPERNRLISGLSSITVLVEAGEESGSLITARLALEQGRDVCAVPGSPTSPVSRGCHRMIRQGAALVTCARDVLEELGQPCETLPLTAAASARQSGVSQPVTKPVGQNPRQVSNVALSDLATNVLNLLATDALQFDEILAMANASAQQVSQGLIELQLAGFVRQGPDGYIRVL